ncbi:phosphotransferase [Umezawaea sp. Da 62-37]|uniref:phosphotransferase n=1 Tax=Umezawaea sp. Da 62-37 TaxID=3075927 RepID=UPI0028F7073C|nr:phosphotransferase [Umezawaea sp. Da 62-37]WNV90344.1 phosphotransferase [Umezawaea sp. Da 62-37]
MKVRRDWYDLPEGVRLAVEHNIGQVLKTDSPTAGRNSELALTLWSEAGPVYCKGITTASSAWSSMHRNEMAVNPSLPDELAPRLLWHVETEGWLLLGFEHVSGQHADLSPDSADLPLVADAVAQISRTPLPPAPVARRSMSEQWARGLAAEIGSPLPPEAESWSAENLGLLDEWAIRAPDHMDGSSLAHTDLHPANILVSGRAQIIDWAWWRTAAPWVDPAFLLIRLIAEGHDPEAAEKWGCQFDGFSAAPPEALTAFVASVVRMWERRFSNTAATEAARQWARYRLS